HADEHVARHADARAVACRSDDAPRHHEGRCDGRDEPARPVRIAPRARRLRQRRAVDTDAARRRRIGSVSEQQSMWKKEISFKRKPKEAKPPKPPKQVKEKQPK